MTLHDQLFGAPDVDACFDDAAHVQAMLDVEAALAEAQAAAGVIPADAADAIRAMATVGRYDLAALATAAAEAGNAVIPLVAALTARVAASDEGAARYVHWGATSQDVLDTALALQLRAARPRILDSLDRAAQVALDHARRYATTPMAGRTLLRQSTPITFGLVAAGWADALVRRKERLAAAFHAAAVLQFGGASGTLAAQGARALEVAEALGRRLRLPVPPLPWHAHRDRLADLAAALGAAAGTLGKTGRDLALLGQTEVGEIRETAAPGSGGSSAMPHKRNPLGAAIAIAAATRAPGLVATMLAAMPQEHQRGLGGWHAEWNTLPELVRLTAGSANAVADALEGIEADPERMAENLALTDGLISSEAVTMALAERVGREAAHALVGAACRRADAEGRPLGAVLADDAGVKALLSAGEIAALVDPARGGGAAAELAERTVRRLRRDSPRDG